MVGTIFMRNNFGYIIIQLAQSHTATVSTERKMIQRLLEREKDCRIMALGFIIRHWPGF
jgi:hypothetical protein